MRVLITGGSSYLGQHLVPLALPRCSSLIYTTLTSDPLGLAQARPLDLRDRAAVLGLGREFRPNVIIHTAGSNRSADMTRVIVEGARHICELATETNARLLHLSTDVIFDGTQSPYDESAEPRPLHDYGRAKASAEAVVADYPNHVIVRTSLIYSLTIMDRGTEWVVAALARGEPVTLFTNQLRCPVSAESLSLALLELATNPYRGILNLVGDQAMSRAEFGLKLLDWWGIDAAQRQTLTTAPDNGARWPLDVRLSNALARNLLRTPLPGADVVLAGGQRRPSN
jgi:dTDP-4-dehydrorhamnose reductase